MHAKTPRTFLDVVRDKADHDRAQVRGWLARLFGPLRAGYRAALRGRRTPASTRADNGTQRCSGCLERHRDDQQVPDPGQFTGKELGGELRMVDAPMIHCLCGGWYHAIGCFSTHRDL